jgi:hypothetical protein
VPAAPPDSSLSAAPAALALELEEEFVPALDAVERLSRALVLELAVSSSTYKPRFECVNAKPKVQREVV